MRWKGLRIVLTVGIVPCVMGCGSTQNVQRADVRSMKAESMESVQNRDSIVIADKDTLCEVTTITIQTDEKGDTLRVSTVTDRTRARTRSDIRSKSEDVKVIRDTMYIEKRDSMRSEVRGLRSDHHTSAFNIQTTLKWICLIIVSLTVLLIVVKGGL